MRLEQLRKPPNHPFQTSNHRLAFIVAFTAALSPFPVPRLSFLFSVARDFLSEAGLCPPSLFLVDSHCSHDVPLAGVTHCQEFFKFRISGKLVVFLPPLCCMLYSMSLLSLLFFRAPRVQSCCYLVSANPMLFLSRLRLTLAPANYLAMNHPFHGALAVIERFYP